MHTLRQKNLMHLRVVLTGYKLTTFYLNKQSSIYKVGKGFDDDETELNLQGL